MSDETKKFRRNSVLASGLCLFIGLTGVLPEKFALLGVSFESPEQQYMLAWFIFYVSLYLFLHFISAAIVEIARWVHPLFTQILTKRKLLKHPAFDETDWMDIPYPIDDQDKNEIGEEARSHSEWKVGVKLKPFYSLIYLQLTIEIIVPISLGCYGLFKLAKLIISLASGTN